MNPFISYLAQTALSFGIFYLLYWLFLRQETFFRFNRYYFLASIVLAFIIPFLDFGNLDFFKDSFPVNSVSYDYVSLQDPIPDISTAYLSEDSSKHSLAEYMLVLYLLGVGLLLFRLIYQMIKLFLKIWKARILRMYGTKIILDKKVNSPFSFFFWIFLNPSQIKEPKISDIILHEKEHIYQKHSFDLFLVELMCSIQWANPFVWLLRKSIKETHEYLADRAVLDHGIQVQDYQKLLLSQSMGVGYPSLITPLNYSINKKRMIMMKKIKSPNIRKWRSLLIIPVVLFLGLAFSNPFSGGSTFKDQKDSAKSFLVKGKVTTEDIGSPLSGVIIFNEEELTGTITDNNGEFEIEVQGEKAILSIALKGYETQEVQVNSDKYLNIVLRIVTNEKGPGSIGKESVVKISSIDAALYIIDGKEVSKQEFNKYMKDPALIQSVSILKEESAVKKFGEKGRNGVILISSKGISAETSLLKYEVYGKVVNAKTGEPIPGVSIVISNTNSGTVSDLQGKFKLQLPEEKVQVVFSFVGLATVKREVKNGDNLVIKLKKTVANLNLDLPEVVHVEEVVKEESVAEVKSSPEIFYVVEDMPHFPGGKAKLSEYISSNIKYPKNARKSKIEGTVPVNFTVDAKGYVKNVFVAKGKGIDPDLDKEAIRIISEMPKWDPGAQRGKKVDVDLSVPVKFTL